MRILVVDDDEPTQVLVEALFRPLQVLVEKALRLLRTKAYDAIVLDLLLPRVNGFDLLRSRTFDTVQKGHLSCTPLPRPDFDHWYERRVVDPRPPSRGSFLEPGAGDQW